MVFCNTKDFSSTESIRMVLRYLKKPSGYAKSLRTTHYYHLTEIILQKFILNKVKYS